MVRAVRSFRDSMGALHTWAGVVLGAVMFAIFFMGTLSVFDREIDRWMMPSTRVSAPPPALSLDATVRPSIDKLASNSNQWSVTLPTERAPTLVLRYQDASGSNVARHIDPHTGTVLEDTGSLGGTGFIYPFHFRLHLDWLNLGTWLVGLAGMGLLVLFVSGVVIHGRLVQDFFTFRPHKPLRRSSLDLHTLTGVVGLPFHFMMALSGLIIFFSVFFPWTWKVAYQGDNRAFASEAFGGYRRPPQNRPGTVGSLDAMLAEAERLWDGGKPSLVRVAQPRDAASVVEVRRSSAREVTSSRDQIYFDGSSGKLLSRYESPPVGRVQRFIAGMHLVQFQNWTLRWLYFLGGLTGSVMIATGLIYWLEARRKGHAQTGASGVRWVESLTVFSVAGLLVSTLTFFVANRLLPSRPTFAGVPREEIEIAVFYVAWFGSLTHAVWRRRRAWIDQVRASALLAGLAVIANWVSTGDHPLRAIQRGVGCVAGMDAVLLCTAAIGVIASRRLARHATTMPAALSAAPALGPGLDAKPHA
jgi:uncharacterized iron-regulated membrane protein